MVAYESHILFIVIVIGVVYLGSEFVKTWDKDNTDQT